MKLGIMQPYFFPYIGYYQLINAVDKYIILDDVNFIKGGWINRNHILIHKEPKYINLPLKGGSRNVFINKMSVSSDLRLYKKNLKDLYINYRKAPYYEEVYPLLEEIILYKEENLAKWLENSIRKVCEYLEINTPIIVSSTIDKDYKLKCQDKVIDLCKKMNADEYVNAIGGQKLYSKEEFMLEGIKLNFLHTNNITYNQFCKNMIAKNLSIIDVMMFNSKKDIKKMLGEYTLI
ncbi:WbqC family protein [Terrisporobacter sp.]